MFARLCSLIAAAAWLPTTAVAADFPAGAVKGQSQMSTGFTPPEKKASRPKPWTRDDLNRARAAHRHHFGDLPRCEQDRPLTDKTPCDSSTR